ncbi:MAG: vWA domain-containing protein, partial [Planctomycetota bacterium]
MSMAFQRPELFALLIPVLWLAWRARRDQHPITTALRVLGAGCLAGALAGPYLQSATTGRFAVFVVDRSASMPGGSDGVASELIGLGLDAREDGDEVRVVSFGEEARIESSLGTDARGFESFQTEVNSDGSDLAAGIDAALSLIPKGRQGGLVVVSDGDVPSSSSLDAALLAAAGRGVRIDVRETRRQAFEDTAIERVGVAPEVFAGEPFLITAWVSSSVRATRTIRLMLGSQVLETRSVELPPGRSLVRFRTLRARAGIGAYHVDLVPLPGPDGRALEDRFPENDSALAATRILGPKAVLVVNHDGQSDLVTKTLIAAGIPAIATTPEAMPRSVSALDGIRAVVLENVSAARVGLARLETLRAWTLTRGGGL